MYNASVVHATHPSAARTAGIAERDTKEEINRDPFATRGNTQVWSEDAGQRAEAEHAKEGKKRQGPNGMKQTPSHMLEQLDKTICST